MIVVERDANLVQLVLAARPARRFASSLHGRQQQRDKYADDRDYHQQLDKRKTV
jgi:hypothetical protein